MDIYLGHMGLTLVFAKKRREDYLVEKRTYLIKECSSKEILKTAEKFGAKYIAEMTKEGLDIEYIGVNDVFYIYKPFSNNSLIGISSYRAKKTLSQAKDFQKNYSNKKLFPDN